MINTQDIASFSLLGAQYDTTLALTICSIILCVIRLLSFTTRIQVHTHYSAMFWFRVFGIFMEIAANAQYLNFIQVTTSFRFSPSIDTGVFFYQPFSYIDDITQIFAIAAMWTRFKIVSSLGIVVLLLDAVTNLDFHPSSALVSGVLSNAYRQLLSFIFVFVLIILVYGFVGMLIFSRNVDYFSDYSSSINSLLLMSLGELGDVSQATTDVRWALFDIRANSPHSQE